ncbi:MAG: S41 family peptidase [Acidimicrobiia bacterium]
MNHMRGALIVGVAVFVTACAQSAAPPTTAGENISPPASAPTTTLETQEYVIQGCTSPPVTFSALCEIHELVHQWHVDRPVDDAKLAAVAIQALDDFVAVETEPRPRTLQCAAPSPDFEDFCVALAARVLESGIVVADAVDAAVEAMANIGLDPFSYYVPPDQVGSFRQNGVVGGVGVLLDATDAVGSKCARIGSTCELEIVYVVEDNPGAEAGLADGDVIVAVDGETVEGQSFAATAGAIAGDETGTVQITIQRGEEILVFDIERAQLTVPTVVVDVPRSGVGYVRIPDFEDDIPSLVDDALVSLADFAPGTIVIDLRDNPGGFIDSVVEVASQFIDGGTVLISDGPDEHLEYPADEGGLATSERLIVLVNQGTASAGEILAGALKDRRNAVIVGTNTFGKNAVQIPFTLRNGGEMYVAVARWVTPGGTSAGKGGLTPDRELELSADLTNEEVVEAALDAAS